MFEDFTDEERRALLLIKVYEDERRKTQYGYKTFRVINEEIKTTPLFRQFLTVAKWIEEQRFHVSWTHVHWQGFIEYVFTDMHPRIPQPGQLKNKLLLGKYISASPEFAEKVTHIDKIYRIYLRILHPDILYDTRILTAIGLEGLSYVVPRRTARGRNTRREVNQTT